MRVLEPKRFQGNHLPTLMEKLREYPPRFKIGKGRGNAPPGILGTLFLRLMLNNCVRASTEFLHGQFKILINIQIIKGGHFLGLITRLIPQ